MSSNITVHESGGTTNTELNSGSSKGKYDLKLKDTLDAFFSKGFPVVNIFMLLSFVGKMQYHKDATAIKSMWSIVYLTSLILSFFIDGAMNMECLTPNGNGRCMTAYLTTILRFFAASALLLFLDIKHAVVMPFLLVVLVLVTYYFCQTFDTGRRPGVNWGNHKEELNRLFDMSVQVVSMAFAGLSGKVLGYGIGSSNLTVGYIAVVLTPECFLFYGLVLGMLVVLLCTVPPWISRRTDRNRMAKEYIPIMAYLALFFLLVASVVAAAQVLREYVYLSIGFFAIAVVAVVIFYCCEDRHAANRNISGRRVNPEENDGIPITNPIAGTPTVTDAESMYSKYIVSAYLTSLFAALMASHSKYGVESGTVLLSWWLKVFVLSAVCSILSYTIRMALLARMRDPNLCAIFRKAWIYASYMTTGSTVVSAVLAIWMRPGEVKDIF